MIPYNELDSINYDVNMAIRYRPDIEVHRRIDRWQTPEETMRLGTGDCEDYAILKAWRLAQLGHSVDDMRIVVVRVGDSKSLHAALYCDSQYDKGFLWWKKRNVPCTYILDNMTDNLYRPDQVRHTVINIYRAERFFDAANRV